MYGNPHISAELTIHDISMTFFIFTEAFTKNCLLHRFKTKIASVRGTQLSAETSSYILTLTISKQQKELGFTWVDFLLLLLLFNLWFHWHLIDCFIRVSYSSTASVSQNNKTLVLSHIWQLLFGNRCIMFWVKLPHKLVAFFPSLILYLSFALSFTLCISRSHQYHLKLWCCPHFSCMEEVNQNIFCIVFFQLESQIKCLTL